MSNTSPAQIPDYTEVSTAPIVYFDGIAAHGTLNGAIQIELASRIMTPKSDGSGVTISFVACGRLRCSPSAAISLRESIDTALKMLEQPQQSPAAASKLN